ncbi:DUF3060 domain-containing protein [Mycobacterium sp. PS03-16]|uniref:DUF3060 domain-containing protein n=1 Tax=Mycobacterium sp. PS03-16 TaxID=2559611 RepID=UPI001ADD7CEF|nr:DUF3060 domain-containing protein [Mycobacterium sp. PS03-16]
MNPQDDPEARIRDLERPLADRAQASELGTQPYTVAGSYPPPPPHPDAHAPYPGAPQPYPPAPPPYSGAPPSGGPSQAGVIVLVVVVLALLVVGAGVAIYFANLGSGSDGVTGRPTIAGGGGALDQTREVGPTDDLPIVVAPGLPTGDPNVVEQAPAGGQLSIAGVEGDKRVACNDSVISVSGVSNTVTITGHCVSVTVSGMDNEVIVDNADVISASGFENRVTFRSGEPQINNSGDNIVERG